MIYRSENYQNSVLISYFELYDDSGTIKWRDGSTVRNATITEIVTYNNYQYSLLTDGTTITSTTTLPPGKFTFFVNVSGGPVTLTPSTELSEYTIIKTDTSTNKVTIAGTINGDTNYTLDLQYSMAKVMGSGTTYFITGGN